MPRSLVGALAVAVSLVVAAPALAAPTDSPTGANDFGCKPTAAHPRPVVLVHGLGAQAKLNWEYVSPKLKAQGYCVFAQTYGIDPRTKLFPYAPGGVVKMEQSSHELAALVDRVLAATGAQQVDIVGHSEGTVMPRYYLERLGGAAKVKNFVALTPLWRGTSLAGLPLLRDLAAPYGLSQPLVALVAGLCGSCPEFLSGSPYLNDLNRDGEAVPGIEHTNIISRYDELVQPYTSGIMRDGGHNIVLQDVCPKDVSEHGAVAFDPNVVRLIENALDPATAAHPAC